MFHLKREVVTRLHSRDVKTTQILPKNSPLAFFLPKRPAVGSIQLNHKPVKILSSNTFSASFSPRPRAFFPHSCLLKVSLCRVQLGVDHATGSTYSLEADRATDPPYV